MKPLESLKHHVTGAIERGEAVAITAIEPAPFKQGARMKPFPPAIAKPVERSRQRSQRSHGPGYNRQHGGRNLL